MGFKLYSDSLVDRPLVACDVCSQPIYDLINDKATGSPGRDGQISDVTIHHATCVATGTVTMSFGDFLRLLAIQSRVGDVGSDQGVDTAHVQYPTGGRFEP